MFVNSESTPCHLPLHADRYALLSLIDILDRNSPTYDTIYIARLIASICVPVNGECSQGCLDHEAAVRDDTTGAVTIESEVTIPNPSSNSGSDSWNVELYDIAGDTFLSSLESPSILPSSSLLALHTYELGLIGAEDRAMSLLAEALRWGQPEVTIEAECDSAEEERKKCESEKMIKVAAREKDQESPAGWDAEWAQWVKNHYAEKKRKEIMMRKLRAETEAEALTLTRPRKRTLASLDGPDSELDNESIVSISETSQDRAAKRQSTGTGINQAPTSYAPTAHAWKQSEHPDLVNSGDVTTGTSASTSSYTKPYDQTKRSTLKPLVLSTALKNSLENIPISDSGSKGELEKAREESDNGGSRNNDQNWTEAAASAKEKDDTIPEPRMRSRTG
jgi:hypothetical protein